MLSDWLSYYISFMWPQYDNYIYEYNHSYIIETKNMFTSHLFFHIMYYPIWHLSVNLFLFTSFCSWHRLFIILMSLKKLHLNLLFLINFSLYVSLSENHGSEDSGPDSVSIILISLTTIIIHTRTLYNWLFKVTKLFHVICHIILIRFTTFQFFCIDWILNL